MKCPYLHRKDILPMHPTPHRDGNQLTKKEEFLLGIEMCRCALKTLVCNPIPEGWGGQLMKKFARN